MTTKLAAEFAATIRGWPEFRMGVHRVSVALGDGQTVNDVMVAGGEVQGVLGRDDIPFDATDVVGVTDYTDTPLPPGY